MYELSYRNYQIMPWLVYDFKGDKLINQIVGAKHIGLRDFPATPGLYIVHPGPDDDVQPQLWEAHKRGNVGIFVDEGYMMGRFNRAFRALLTQGRSKQIPMMVLSQRPVWMDTFVFTESQFFTVFHLQHKGDKKNVEEFVPIDMSQELPRYHSYHYDQGERRLSKLGPVPDIKTILATFEQRLSRRREAI